MVSKGLKHQIKELVRACNTGKPVLMLEPAELAYGTLEKEKGIYQYKLTKWLKESDQWEETNNKLYIRLMLH